MKVNSINNANVGTQTLGSNSSSNGFDNVLAQKEMSGSQSGLGSSTSFSQDTASPNALSAAIGEDADLTSAHAALSLLDSFLKNS